MSDDGVSIARADAEAAARDLEEFVVSFDRLLSRIGTGGADPSILCDYVAERRVLPRLARLRRVVHGALEDAAGAEAVDEIAESAQIYGGP